MVEMRKEELDECMQTIWMLWCNHVEDSGHERKADGISSNLMSENGLLNAPAEVLQMLAQALEVGYVVAVSQVEGDR